MYKLVNGIRLRMTDEELAQREALARAHELREVPQLVESTLERLVRAIEEDPRRLGRLLRLLDMEPKDTAEV